MDRTKVAERNRRKVTTLHPLVQLKVGEYLAICEEQLGILMLVTDAYRSLEEQAKLYAIGRSRPGRKVTWVKPGGSFHNFGLASDVYPLLETKPANFVINFDESTPEGRAYLAFADYAWPIVRPIASQVGFELLDLSNDPPHVQWTGGWRTAELLADGYGYNRPIASIPLPKFIDTEENLK